MKKYYMLNKKTLVVNTFSNPNSLVCHLLGRELSNYIIIKENLETKRTETLKIKSSDVKIIQKELELLEV